MKKQFIFFTVIVFLIITGCSKKPEDIKIASGKRLLPSETQSIMENLDEKNRAIFQRWTVRINRGETLEGEPPVSNAREAIANQLLYEEMQAERFAREKEKELEKKRKEEIHRKNLESIISTRKIVDEEIRKYIDVTILTYKPQTVLNYQNYPIARFFEFYLRITNKTDLATVGIAGFVNIEDVFGNRLGSYPFAIEPHIKSQKSINYIVTLDYNENDPQHAILWQSNRINYKWFFESVAFENGVRIDSETISDFNSRENKVKKIDL